MPLEAIELEAHETKRKERGVICEAAVFYSVCRNVSSVSGFSGAEKGALH